MNMSMGFFQSQIQIQQVVGGITQSIFMKAEGWLLLEADHQNALRFVAHNKSMNAYTSMMDFLFCEIFINYRHACRRFYDGRGPQLREMISLEQIAKFDEILLGALKIAHEAFCEQRAMSWVKFRLEALRLAA